MSLSHSKGATKKVSSLVSLKLNGIIANHGPLLRIFCLGMGQLHLLLDQVSGSGTIVGTIPGVAVTIPAVLRPPGQHCGPVLCPQGRLWSQGTKVGTDGGHKASVNHGPGPLGGESEA